MERDPYYHIKDVSRKLTLVGTLIGASVGGAVVYREVAPPYPEILPESPSITHEMEPEKIPTPRLSDFIATPASESAKESSNTFIINDDCFSINSLYSPEKSSQNTCQQKENQSLLREWIKAQPQSFGEEQLANPTPDTTLRESEPIKFDPVSFCRKTVQEGTTYSEFESDYKNIESCYRIFGISSDMINPLTTRQKRTNYKITSSSLSSGNYASEESVFTLVDDAPSPSEWNNPK